MGDDEVVVQIVRKVCDLREPLTLHDNEGAKHSLFGKTLAPCARSSLLHGGNIQMREQRIVELRLGRCCEEADILQYFLSLDNGHPLSG